MGHTIGTRFESLDLFYLQLHSSTVFIVYVSPDILHRVSCHQYMDKLKVLVPYL